MSDQEYTDDLIVSIDQAEWYRRRLFQPAKIDTLYVIMGYLQEYFGGYHWHEETVDMFFVNEYEKALLFWSICQYYLAELNAENDIEFIKVETGHSYLKSRLICEQLKEQFTDREPDYLNHKCFRLSKDNDLFKHPKDIPSNYSQMFNFKRYSYLLGVILKNQHKNRPEIHFANAGHKAELLIDILKEFSAFGDTTFRVDYHFNVPHVTMIKLSKTNAIWAELEKYKAKIREATQGG